MMLCRNAVRFAKILFAFFGLLVLGATAVHAADTAMVVKCKADLAQRLKLPAKEIALIVAQPTVWPNAALGMPEADKMYAQVQTPGYTIVLEAKNNRYLYTASAKAFRYGGPAALWSHSMLYLQAVPDEPDLNGDLYQCSLIGTNHRLLISGVSEFYPQANGKVIAKRRTSRSGHALLLVDAAQPGKEQKLLEAFDFGEAALNGDEWAGFVRPGLGAIWNVTVAHPGQEGKLALPLPEGARPQRIAWVDDRLMILVTIGEKSVYYETTPHAAEPAWKAVDGFSFPGVLDFVLNKSQTLEIGQAPLETKPCVEIALVWFTGDRDVVARIDGLTLRGCELIGWGYAFIWGEQNGVPAAYSVQIRSGEVTPGFHGKCEGIKPFDFPPLAGPVVPGLAS